VARDLQEASNFDDRNISQSHPNVCHLRVK
jgi:hypothetical protein